MQENSRRPGAVRPRVPGINLVDEIAHRALFMRDYCTCESISTCNADNIEISPATLNGVTVNSYYKPANHPFYFRNSTTNTPLQVIIGDFNSHSTGWGYILQIHN